MIGDEQIQQAVEELARRRGFFVVAIQNKKGKITVIIDDYEGIKLDECVEVNRELRQMLGSPIDACDLEVTSPGLTEPFKVYQQYEKHIGQKVQVLLNDGRQINGKLLEVTGQQITVEEKKRVKNQNKKKKTLQQQHSLSFEDIHHTKLQIAF